MKTLPLLSVCVLHPSLKSLENGKEGYAMSARKCLVMLALTFAWCSLSGPAFAQQRARMLFAEMDRDGDGVITRGEWTGSAEAFRTQDCH